MKILASGLGGGLDIVNASLIYFAAKNEDNKAMLSSVRPVPLKEIQGHQKFDEYGTIIREATVFDNNKRHVEAKIAGYLGEDILYFARRDTFSFNPEKLKYAIWQAKKKYQICSSFFVDGGGDSLILSKGDAGGTSEDEDPLKGGDAETLEALYTMPKTYLAVIAAGLDIKPEKFEENVELLRERGDYYGKVNLRTGKKKDYRLEKILRFEKGFLKDYFNLAEKILVLNEADLKNKNKVNSHTAVVTYHALKGNYGLQRTYVDWEPTVKGKKGVMVDPKHCWMYFFDASKIHEIKLELQN